MAEKKPGYKLCRYCKCRKALKERDICSGCNDKLRLVRKLVAEGQRLKRLLEELDEKEHQKIIISNQNEGETKKCLTEK